MYIMGRLLYGLRQYYFSSSMLVLCPYCLTLMPTSDGTYPGSMIHTRMRDYFILVMSNPCLSNGTFDIVRLAACAGTMRMEILAQVQ
jgi:hypothetical protein